MALRFASLALVTTLIAGCSGSSGKASPSASATAAPEVKKSATAASSAAPSATAAATPSVPADIAFFQGDIPAGVKLDKGASSDVLGFTIKRPGAWTFGMLPGSEMLMVSKDKSVAIFCVLAQGKSDDAAVTQAIKAAPILGSDYKALSTNKDVQVGAAKFKGTTGHGTAKVFGGDGDVYWMTSDATLFVLAAKKDAPADVLDEARGIARSMTAPKAAPE